jgi:bla regulator protein blaR1
MMMSHLWNSAAMNALVAHLWQSTAFAALAWIFTLALRNYPARGRFWVWMAASIKFLVPFSMLTALGIHWTRPSSPGPRLRTIYSVIEQINRPFAGSHPPAPSPAIPVHTPVDRSWIALALVAVWLCGCVVMLVRWAWQWRSARRLVREAASLDEGREIDALRRHEAIAQIRRPIPVVVTPKTVEPGIFGLFRPVLIWPAGLSDRLDDAQIASIVAHELEHVRRRDNLVAALHSLVQAVFWFHPAVWWMGARMTEERERACDERVLEQNAEPHTYADGILKVCAFCLEAPLTCVAGVSGSDLRKRVLRITSHRPAAALNLGRRLVLVAAAASALALPIGYGAVRGQSSTVSSSTSKSSPTHEVPRFDVVSIKPTAPTDDKTLFQYFPDSTSFRGAPVGVVLQAAFGVDDGRITGAPSWVNTNRYDIEAKVAPEDAPRMDKLNGDDRRAMLVPLLVDRFHLKYHHQTREQSTYALTVANGGPRLTRGDPDPPPGWKPDKDLPMEKERFWIMAEPGHIEANSIPMHILAEQLTRMNILGRLVVDKTGLTGNYNFTLRWTPDNDPFPGLTKMLKESDGLGASATDTPPSPLFTALREQLGLKLEPGKGSVDVIVIDHIDPPSPN